MTDQPLISIKVPNPFFEGRNQIYVIPSDPVTLIDSGVATQRAFDALVQGLGQHGFSIRDIGCVVLTHKHIDHIGNAWRIQKESGAEIMIHESEVRAVRDVDPDSRRYRKFVKERLAQWRVPDEAFPGSENPSGPIWEIETATPTPVVDGQRIDLGSEQLEVIHTPGHTYGSICLKYGRRLLSGDHILPDITPNIGGGDLRRRGLLSDFLHSLRRISALAADIDQVLPGHGEPFGHLAERCQELREHHRQRLDNVIEILRREGPQQVYETAGHLFGDMQDIHVILGCAEAQAHLDYLVDQGEVTCELGEYQVAGSRRSQGLEEQESKRKS
jgi:glyoxylase-like metal-dependent hydrolase (beta-lactamase superfamily II)